MNFNSRRNIILAAVFFFVLGVGVAAIAFRLANPPKIAVPEETAPISASQEAAAPIEAPASPAPTETPAATEKPSRTKADGDEAQSYTLTASAVIYRTADPESRVLAELPKGTPLELTGYIKDDMVNIRTADGTIGYIESSLVDEDIVAELTQRRKPAASTLRITNLFDASYAELTMEGKLKALKKLLPDGKYWNSVGVDTEGLSQNWFCAIVTDTPCAHAENGYEYCHEYNGVTSALFGYPTNIQCLGFASLVSDFLFGKDAPLTQLDSFSQLQAGDHIRFMDYEHSMIVTEVTADSVMVVQCNSDYENCKIEWDTVYSREEIEAYYDVMYISRYEAAGGESASYLNPIYEEEFYDE